MVEHLSEKLGITKQELLKMIIMLYWCNGAKAQGRNGASTGLAASKILIQLKNKNPADH
jgi:hypothetical protein